MLTVRRARGLGDFHAAHALIAEMAQWDAGEVARLGLCNEDVISTYYAATPGELMQRFSGEDGSMFLGTIEGFPIGCGAVAVHDGAAEVLTLYVRPAARGKGAGRALMAAVMAEAKRAGGRSVRLVTTDFMVDAIALYSRFGFARCEAFEPTPESLRPITVYMSTSTQAA
jgi:ribosomal protein S18 acetylase RimI-like enzyme